MVLLRAALVSIAGTGSSRSNLEKSMPLAKDMQASRFCALSATVLVLAAQQLLRVGVGVADDEVGEEEHPDVLGVPSER